MSFSAEWLALREPADRAARNGDLAGKVAAHLAGRGEVSIIDLGAGTGANVRALSPLIEARQTWRLVDRDGELLARAPGVSPLPDGVRVEAEVRDLAHDLESLDFNGVDLVCASALIDLVSGAWFDEILAKAAAAGSALYVTLSYTGDVVLDPADSLDATVIDCVNRHQRGDKGFGAALGPDCVAHMAAACARAGYRVSLAPSDWQLAASDGDLQRELLTGWAAAAGEIAPSQAGQFDAWLEARTAQIDSGALRVTVGHGDLFAWP